MKKNSAEKNYRILLILLLIIFFISILPLSWNELIENVTIDLQFQLRGERNLSDKIVVVFITDEDARALHGWPITRDYYGFMIHILNQLGAKVIGLDIFFDQTDRNYPEYDQMLAEMISSANCVCLPMVFSDLSSAPGTEAKFSRLPTGFAPLFPLTLFQDRVAGSGFSNFDKAATIRKAPVVAAYQDSFMLSFGCELARLYLGCTTPVTINSHAITMTDSVGNRYSFPIDRKGRLRLNHFGNIHHLPAVGFIDLLQTFETAPESINFKDKMVVIAVTVSSIVKLKSTPLSNGIPATLIHVTVAENLIHQNYLRTLPIFFNLIIIGLMVVLAWLSFQSRKTIIIGTSALSIIVGYWIIAMVVFYFAHTILPLFYPMIAFMVTMAYFSIIQSHKRLKQDDAIKSLLNEQIKIKAAELETAKAKLAEVQDQLRQEVTITEQTEQLAAQRQNAIFKLEKELRDLQTYVVPEKPQPKTEFAEIIHSENSKMARVLELVATVSNDDIPVSITGETGTGKEMVAHAIHNLSKRKHAPFVAVNCGALSETLLESELFGHEKGSFTGAHSRRRGRFELANGGTIFLDEITETTPAFQTRLLRVLQESSFERLGGEQTIKVDVRVITATNKNLQVEMENNRFRSDLFYRLSGFPIPLPPLRERKEDIPLLVLHFLKKHHYSDIQSISDRAMEILTSHHWPGNVREIENVVRRAAILALSEKRNIIRESDLPKEILKCGPNQTVPIDYKPLEDQILERLRSFAFSRSAISQTAGQLGHRDRGTITEYFRGICFENLVQADFNIEAAASLIANTTDRELIDQVKLKIHQYLNNLQPTPPDLNINDTSPENMPSAFKGLPKKYHPFLQQIIQNLDKIH